MDFFSKSKLAPPLAPKRDVLSNSSFFHREAFKSALPSSRGPGETPCPAAPPCRAQGHSSGSDPLKWLHPAFLLIKIRCLCHFVSLFHSPRRLGSLINVCPRTGMSALAGSKGCRQQCSQPRGIAGALQELHQSKREESKGSVMQKLHMQQHKLSAHTY